MTKILKCDCKNDYQDQHYGVSMRVHNVTLEPEKTGYRCTVCGKTNK